MTGPKRHKRPPNQFRRRSLIIMAVFTTMVVALGVGTASAGLRGDRDGRDGWRNSSGRHGHNNGNNGSQSANPSTTTSVDPSATASGDPDESASADPSATDPSATDPAEGGGEETEAPDNGIDETDYIDIRQVPTVRAPRFARNGSRGSFNSIRCTLQDRHNSDNFIAAPGVVNAAHHVHDYTGNTTTDANSTDESLAAGGTTCNQGDKSAYFWPVFRDATVDTPNRFPGELEEDLNTGQLLIPRFTIRFEGNPRSKVAAMPQNIRVLAGDAKAPVNGGANQRSAFTCQGFTNRISVDKYTLCPNGRGFTSISEFPSCWDGQNTDSANHRTHIVYPDAQGNCPASNPVVVPKLVITLTYNTKPGPTFRFDSFPESTHEPSSSHNDFFNLIPQNVMNRMVQCINTGRRC
ncbi:DUF1996 domain-containing protein [Cryptosporangium aurantiacum]|uniref:DUF1996 domain-containing protein n=1 Tax=Cryptosporangium aurantiacum TaxID=134849 RepID=A0A1M7PUG1_9ACTN|nr:DUF1996 domain-containing protein [Cryptosporangium aurantiacum]SHN21162.1 protein of unknown function [Cryptosporangium aurantiacum]